MKLHNGHRDQMEGYHLLETIALDLHWSWSHKGDTIWKQLDAELWNLTHNPWVVLQTVSNEKLTALLENKQFHSLLDDFVKTREEQDKAPAWFQQKFPNTPLNCVAYFSMEFMLSEALPIYSGGLGNVAGDQLKAASDMGVPVVGVGLLYQQGYFRQIIDAAGRQQEIFPYNDPGQLPISPLRKPNGEWIRLEVKLPGWSVWLRAWEVRVGRCKLYLLDSNDAANYPHRGITSELYGGDSELRLKQEMMLGIAGWRLLDALGINPEVCHLNEGHAAFAVLERANIYKQKNGCSFEVALTATRAGNVFTTHTAVSEGFDHYSPALIAKYLGNYATKQLGISIDELLQLGRVHADDEDFNMTYLAIRGSQTINGVSRLHEEVSRKIFAPLFLRWPFSEIPIGHVTNGVHMPSWDSADADDLWTKACGKCRWLGMTEGLEDQVQTIPIEQIWQMRNHSRQMLIEYARGLLARQLAARGAPQHEIQRAKTLFDPNFLTLGFARRFVPYKRPNLLLHDPDRLLSILSNADRPVQLIIAGKAHPADKQGKALIQEWMRFIPQDDVRSHVVFLSDYDMVLTEHLVQGVDVWLNTPRRPWEASGTSGMKVLVNGGLNFSEIDGWWAEAYAPDVGWAIGDGKEHGHDPAQEALEANQLYDQLEKEIIPMFYTRDSKNVPVEWVSRIRESMSRLTPRFSATRVVAEYTTDYYIPAVNRYLERSENHSDLSEEIVRWKHAIDAHWSQIHFGKVRCQTQKDLHQFTAEVDLDGLDPSFVHIELCWEENNQLMHVEAQPKSLQGTRHLFQASVPSDRPPNAYTFRIVPFHPKTNAALEGGAIIWQC